MKKNKLLYLILGFILISNPPEMIKTAMPTITRIQQNLTELWTL